MRAPAFVLLVTLASVPALGGVSFSFSVTSPGSVLTFAGTARTDGGDARYDFTAGNHPVFNANRTIISKDGGATLLIIDHGSRSYFYRKTDGMRGPVSTLHAPWQVSVQKSKIRSKSAGRRRIAGHEVARHVVTVSYTLVMNLEGESLTAKVDAHAELWNSTRERNTAFPFGQHFLLKTGFPAIDAEISRRLIEFGMPLEQTVSATRTIQGGAAVREEFITLTTDLRPDRVPRNVFDPPAAYSQREPVLTSPDLTRLPNWMSQPPLGLHITSGVAAGTSASR